MYLSDDIRLIKRWMWMTAQKWAGKWQLLSKKRNLPASYCQHTCRAFMQTYSTFKYIGSIIDMQYCSLISGWGLIFRLRPFFRLKRCPTNLVLGSERLHTTYRIYFLVHSAQTDGNVENELNRFSHRTTFVSNQLLWSRRIFNDGILPAEKANLPCCAISLKRPWYRVVKKS